MNMRSVRAATCCCSLSVWALRHFSRGETHVMESWQFANTLNVFCTNTFVDDSCPLSCFHKVFKVLEDRFEASQTVWRSAVSLTGCVSTFLQYVRGRGGRWDHRGHTSRVKPHRTELFTSRQTETRSCLLPAVQSCFQQTSFNHWRNVVLFLSMWGGNQFRLLCVSVKC